MSRLTDDMMRIANNLESELETKASKGDFQHLEAIICRMMSVVDTLVERIAELKGRVEKLEWIGRGDDGK